VSTICIQRSPCRLPAGAAWGKNADAATCPRRLLYGWREAAVSEYKFDWIPGVALFLHDVAVFRTSSGE
jgi:hypothetical protein